jgi:hypothetical protein
MTRIALTEPNTALAGVALETSFARFMASMAVFNNERAPSRRRWKFSSMIETEGGCEKRAWRAGCEKVVEP